jgi:hypothetical protein
MPIIAGRASAAYGSGFGKVISSGVAPFDESGFDALGSVTLASSVTSITLGGIPQTYRHLQVRLFAGFSGSVTAGFFHYNGDNVSGNYSTHGMNGDGASAPGYGSYIDQNQARFTMFAGTSPAARNTMVMDIPDYATQKNKTSISTYGWDNNGSGYIEFTSNNWRSTEPIRTITFSASNSFTSFTSISVYGVK